MALNLAGASTQYIQNAAPTVLDYPFSVGVWVNLAAAGTAQRTIFALSDTATLNNFHSLNMNTGEVIQISSAAGGTTSNTAVTGAIVPGTWIFILARFIASGNRRLSVLNNGATTGAIAGAVTHAVTSTARAAAGLDTMTIGARIDSTGAIQPWDGLIAEWWLADADAAVNDAAATPDALVRQLAYGGPFSVPYLVPRILEYRSFRAHPTIDDPAETYHRGAPSMWTAVNGPTIGQHPPLPYWYQNAPGNTSSLLMV